LDKETLGNEIRKLRKNRNMTQAELSSGICNQSEISRLEKGNVFPSIDILHLIANKLKVPTFYFYEVLIHENLINKKKVTEKILNLVQNKHYEEVYKIAENELQKNKCHPEFKQFLIWQYNVSGYYLKKVDSATCLTELKLLLKKETYGTDILQDLLIKNSIANLYAEKREFKNSIKCYESILCANIDSREYNVLKVKVFYNLCKVLYLDNQIEHSLSKVDQAIEVLRQNHDMSLLGQIYFQKGECLEKLDYPIKDISDCYKNALFFFKLLKLPYYEKVIYEKKQQYVN
jgi:HTH-type transcriptional regulator, pleiotropic regulator of extracellular virulence genes